MSIDYRDFGYGEIGLTIPNPAEPKRVTNADRIRAMTDEILAKWLCNVSANSNALRRRSESLGLNYDDIKRLSPDAQAQIMKQLGKKPSKASKYHAEKDERNGIKFDSKKEARRYDELMLMLKAGKIRRLRLQPEFTLQEAYITPEGERIRAIRYRADFSYERDAGPDTYGYSHWLKVVEDVKGVRTSDYKIKRKAFRARYGYDITEI